MKRYSRLVLVFTVLWKFTAASSMLNLYTDKTETKEILGLESTVYYVRDGRINYNTVGYKMKIPEKVNCVKFTWYERRTTGHLPSQMVASSITYVLTLKSKQDLLIAPTVDMKMYGSVPQTKTSFCVNMTCRGSEAGTAKLVIQLNFTDTSKLTQIFSLNFVRLKDCLKSPISATRSKPVGFERQGDSSNSREVPASDKTKVFYIAVGVACSIIFVIAMAVAAIHVHSMPNPSANKEGSNGDSENQRSHGAGTIPNVSITQPAQRMVKKANGYVPIANSSLKDENGTPQCNGRSPHSEANPNNQRNNTTVVSVDVPPDNNPTTGNENQARTNTNMHSSNYGSLKNNIDPRHGSRLNTNSVNSDHGVTPVETSHILADIEAAMTAQKAKYSHKDIRGELQDISVDMSRITLGSVLHEGTFARIYEGVLTGLEEGKQQGVLVKSVSDTASTEQANLLLIESCLLRGLTHRNLLPILSVCLEDSEHPLIMYQFMNKGNLKLYLKKSRNCEGTTQALTTSDLVHMGIQIAKGMQYLARRKIIHKDIAARNCLVDDELNVKVTDCSLSRDLFASDYHCLGDNENRPVKWMAVESIEHRRFSVATDVWSYGVTLWELLTLGQQPYANIDAFEMLNFLKHGHRIAQPFNCPDELFTMLACCWALSEDERPSFGQLISCLTDFQNALSNFI